MEMFKRIVGAFLVILGVAVAVHTIAEPLYHASTEARPYGPLWDILNPFMAVGLVLGALFAHLRSRGVDGDGGGPVTREFLVAKTLFYGFLFVGILFFWNWFNLRSPAFTAVGPETVSLVWIIVDATLPLLSVAMGLSLLKSGGD